MGASERSTMQPFGDLAPFARVREAIQSCVSPVTEQERVVLGSSAGRVLAEPMRARVDVPNADRAAMDGYATRADFLGGAELLVAGRLAAGDDHAVELSPGTCVEIATGAPLPAGADCVVPVEVTERHDDLITVTARVAPGEHISRRAEDLAAGATIAPAGRRLGPNTIAAGTAGGCSEVSVWRLPRVLVISTGDEVVEADGSQELPPGKVFDSNATALEALCTTLGAVVRRTPIIRDDRAALAAVLDRPDADLVVTIGGTSVGRRDLVSDALARAGDVLVHGVAVRPGKPLMVATVGGVPVVGLPGFPTSCLMMAYVTVAPAVRRLRHRPAAHGRSRATLRDAVVSPAGKTHFMPVALIDGDAVPTFTFSSAVTSMATADGWIEIDADTTELAAGSDVIVSPF